jgi:hypothetical protein
MAEKDMVDDIVRVRDLDFGKVISSSGLVVADSTSTDDSSGGAAVCRLDMAKG